jgi:hypothetical protein
MSQYDLEPKSLPFGLASKDNPSEEELERSGRAIVTLIGKAADAAKSRSDHARDVAQKLSAELGRAEKRVRELEAEVSHYRDRATRAEDWLLRVSKEIEEQFFSDGGVQPPDPRAVR